MIIEIIICPVPEFEENIDDAVISMMNPDSATEEKASNLRKCR